LIVGTGALTLPAAFAGAGWVISLCIILALAVIRYTILFFTLKKLYRLIDLFIIMTMQLHDTDVCCGIDGRSQRHLPQPPS